MLRVLPSTFTPENRVVAGCEKMVQKVASSSTFLQQNLYMLRVLPAQDKLRFWSKWHNFRLWRDSRVISSNQKSVFTQFATTWLVAKQVWTWLVKLATSLFNSFCSNVPKQVARSCLCCPFYRSFTHLRFEGKISEGSVIDWVYIAHEEQLVRVQICESKSRRGVNIRGQQCTVILWRHRFCNVVDFWRKTV